MAERTNIEWCDSTFNPWIGCARVSPACDDCYAARSTPARTLGIEWGTSTLRHRTSAGTWKLPGQWERDHKAFFAQHGRRRRVFCASLADVFDNQVDSGWRSDLMRLILDTPHLDWLLLTKRIGNVTPLLREIAGDLQLLAHPAWDGQLPPNVWMGATVVNQTEADRDIPKLLAVPARVRFLSIEPMLGPIDLTSIRQPLQGDSFTEGNVLVHKSTLDRGAPRAAIDWVICGGESGPAARPMHPDWARSLRDQCAAAGVPYLFKQWGEWHPCGKQMARIGKKAAGRLLDGRTHDGFPSPLTTTTGALA